MHRRRKKRDKKRMLPTPLHLRKGSISAHGRVEGGSEKKEEKKMGAISFPEGFLWGTAASAYQTEGGNYNNDWFRMEMVDQQRPRAKRRMQAPCGDACDHWNRYPEDYDLAQELGVQVHRLSIEWSRVVPKEGRVDESALEHYRQMLQALKERGIKTMLCLHHFTIPLWMLAKGGFENRTIFMRAFREYIEVTVRSLGDLVDYWLPINEPNVVPLGGYLTGFFPPYKINPLAFIRVYRTFFEMHAQSYRTIKRHFPAAPVGVAFAFMHFQPHDPAKTGHRWGAAFANTTANLRFFEGIKTGCIGFPLGLWDALPGLQGAMDFVGLNYYSTTYMKGLIPVDSKAGDVVTDMGWIVYPPGIYACLTYLGKTVDLPIIVTENGVATSDEAFRIRYLDAHIRQVHRALVDGVPVKGYMCWSLTDNFEWDKGFGMRFGLIRIDYATQQRTIKEGGRWFSGVIQKNGLA